MKLRGFRAPIGRLCGLYLMFAVFVLISSFWIATLASSVNRVARLNAWDRISLSAVTVALASNVLVLTASVAAIFHLRKAAQYRLELQRAAPPHLVMVAPGHVGWSCRISDVHRIRFFTNSRQEPIFSFIDCEGARRFVPCGVIEGGCAALLAMLELAGVTRYPRRAGWEVYDLRVPA